MSIPWVDGLSTDPRELGRHKMKDKIGKNDDPLEDSFSIRKKKKNR